jgi:glycosyltransferase involved in cell wall biosynthesis
VTPEVLALNQSGQIGVAIAGMGVSVNCLSMHNGYDVAGILKLRRYLNRINPDIIHSHSRNFAFNWMIRRIHVPKVFTEHGGNLLGGIWKNKWVYKLFGSNYQRFIAISKEMAKAMESCNSKIAERIRVVHNGTDIHQVDSIEPVNSDTLPRDLIDAKFRVGIVGRLVKRKGIDTFLETAAIIARRRRDVVFVVVGDGPLRNELEAKAHQLGIQHIVFFVGSRSDAKRILKILSVFLFTSNYEPFGLVLTEAMAARVPLVALSVKGAVPEIIRDGVDGFAVDRKDPNLLAGRVIRLLDDESLRHYFTQNARRRVERHFSMEENAKRVLCIYKECLTLIRADAPGL